MRKPNRAAKGNGIQAPASIALNAVVLEQRVPTEVRRERETKAKRRYARLSTKFQNGSRRLFQILSRPRSNPGVKDQEQEFILYFNVLGGTRTTMKSNIASP